MGPVLCGALSRDFMSTGLVGGSGRVCHPQSGGRGDPGEGLRDGRLRAPTDPGLDPLVVGQGTE